MFITASHIYPIEGPVLSPGAIEIIGNKIGRMGPIEIIPQGETVLDLKDHILLPGFVNAHCHLELTALGPVTVHENNPHPFVQWIRKLVRLKNELPPEKMTAGIHQGTQKLMQSGVTTVGDHISFNTPWEAIVQSSLRGMLFGESLGITPEVSKDIYATLKFIQQEVEKSASLFKMQVSPHSIHAVYPETLAEVLTNEQGPLSIHLAESPEEVEYFTHQSGALMDFMRERYSGELHRAPSGFQWMKQKRTDFSKTLFIHGNYFSENELQEIGEKKNKYRALPRFT